MSNIYDFDRAQRLWQNSASNQLAGSIDKNPDDVAKAFGYSQDTGVDATTIHENLDEFENDYKSSLASKIIRDNPAITSFVNAHPLHGGLIHDDLGELDKLTETFKRIHQPSGDSPFTQGMKGFAEGFGSQGFGHWQETLSPEWKSLSDKYPITSQLWSLLGVPIEVGMRGFAGVLLGAQAATKGMAQEMGASEQGATKLANDLAGMLEFHLLGGGPKAIEVAGIKPEMIQKEAQTLGPYLKAGVEPPLGVSDIVDKVKEEQAKLDQKALSDLVDDANATKLKERSPEKFQEFLSHLPDGSVRIDAEAIQKLYGDKAPEVGDNLLGNIPDIAKKLASGSVEVSTKDLLAHVDKEVIKELKDDIGVGDGPSINELKELKERVPPQALSLEQTLSQPSPDGRSTQFEFQINDEQGNSKGKLNLRSRGNQLLVDWVEGEGVSTRDIRGILDQLKTKFPEAETISGLRNKDMRTQSIPLRDRELLDSIRKGAGLEPPREPSQPPEGEPSQEPKQVPIFDKAKAFGRSEKELARYQELIAKRDAEDVAYRQARAERQAVLENSDAWKEESDKVRPEVREEIVSRSDVAAHQFFSEGTYLGQKLEKKPKFARDSLTEEQANGLPDSFISNKGLHPDDIANMFGFSSGSDLINSISTMEREAQGFKGDIVKRLVESEIQRRVSAKLGEGAAENLDEAKDHALSLTQMEMLHEQTLALGTKLGVELPLSKARMDWGALSLLNERRFGSLKSDRLLADAGRVERRLEKALLADDPLEAFKAAQQQYIITAMAKEARAVEKEKKAFEKQAKRYSSREVSGIEPEYTNWVHDILTRIGRDVDRTQEDLRTEINAQEDKTLADFLDTKEGMGYDISMPEFLVDPTFKKSLEDMSVRDARSTMYGIKSLIKAGRDERKVGVTGERMERKDFINQAVQQLAELGEVGTPEAAGIHRLGRTFLAGTLQVESLLNRWDKGNAFGIFNNIVGRPMFEAANYRDKLAKGVAKQMVDKLDDKINLKQVIPNTIFKEPVSAYKPTPNDAGNMDWDNATSKAMTRQSLRVVLLNAGNEDNLKRLADGYGLKPEEVTNWLNQHATKEDWKWAQAYGDIFKNLKELSDQAARQRSGVAPESIPILPLDTPHGQFDGWYWPIIKDPTFSTGLEKKKMGKPLFDEEYVRAGTAKGYTKDRTSHIAPISLELDAIPGRLMQEVHDIAFRDAVMNASKVFYDRNFINAVTKFYGKEYGDTLIPWLKDVANSSNGKSAADHTWARWSEFFRQNVVGTLVGFNPRTIEKHTLSAAMNSFTEVGPREFLEATQSLFRNDFDSTKSNWEFAYDKSEEIQRRSQNFVEQVSGAQEQVLDARSWRSVLLHAGTAPVAFGDMLSTRPTWLAEYKKQIEAGRSEGDSIYAADRAVRRAHGSSAITNRPEIMRRNAWAASLYGFFNHIANRQYELAWKAKEAAGLVSKGGVEEAMAKAPSLAAGLFSYVIFPAIVEELVTPLTNDERESWAKKAAKGLVRGASSSWIGVRDFVNAALNAKDGTFGLASTLPKEFTDLTRDLVHKDFGFDRAHAGKTIKHAIIASGAAFGLGNAELGNIAEFLYDLHTGKQIPRDLKALWRGLSKGDFQAKSGPDLIERALPGRAVRR